MSHNTHKSGQDSPRGQDAGSAGVVVQMPSAAQQYQQHQKQEEEEQPSQAHQASPAVVDEQSSEEDGDETDFDDEAVEGFAVYLGMDPTADADLLYIAREAMQAPLPAGWAQFTDEEGGGGTYFYNADTDASSWVHPMDEHYKQLYATERARKDTEQANSKAKALATLQADARQTLRLKQQAKAEADKLKAAGFPEVNQEVLQKLMAKNAAKKR